MNPSFSLDNKVIVVTGASSGIGKQCAITFSQFGAKVVLIARREQELEQTINQMSGKGHHFFCFDLANTANIQDLVNNIIDFSGPIAGFVHCAGAEISLPLSMLKQKHYETLMAINVYSALELIKLFSKNSNFQIGASFVLLSSIAGFLGQSALTAYSLSKGAVLSSVKTLSIELALKGIRVNAISPGWIENTGMTKDAEVNDERLLKYPLGYGNTDDVANACVYLLADASRWVTGINLVIDGGYSAQ